MFLNRFAARWASCLLMLGLLALAPACGSGGGGNNGGGTQNSAPAISVQPTPAQAVTVGTSVSFTVVATGNPTPTYQWKKNGVAVASGGTSATYTITSPVVSDSGTYTVTVTNSVNSVTSNGAVLTVTLPAVAPSITTQPAATQTVTAGGSASFTVVASTTDAGTLTYQWKKGSSTLTGKTSATLTLNPVNVTDTGSYTVVVTNTLNGSTATTTSSAAALTVNPAASAPSITTQPAATQTVTAGGSVSFTVVASVSDGGTLSYQWKKGSTLLGTAATLTINPVAVSNAGNYTVDVTNTLNGTTATTTSNVAALTVNPAASAPSITTQPAATQTVTAGGSVSFTVVASVSDGGTLTYQWKKGSTLLGTAATLTLNPVAVSNAGNYTVDVTNTLNGTTATTTSNVAALTVNPAASAPSITTQPAATQTVTAGGSVSFTVVASVSDGGTLSYQWKKGSTLLGTAATLTINPVAVSNAGNYTVDVTNTLNGTTATTTSNVAALTVNPAASAPSITTQPAATQTVTAGGSVSFTVVASVSDGGTLSYQWKKGSTLLGTAATLTINPVAVSDAGTYTVDVTNTLNGTTATTTSSAAALTVNPAASAPSITTQPAATQTVTAGGSVSFTVVASVSDGGTLTYQWKKGSTLLGTAATLTINPVAVSDAGTYTVDVTNTLNGTTATTTSNVSTLTVNPAGPVISITTHPADTTAIVPDPAVFTVQVANTSAGTTYQWKKDGVDISGATSSTYTSPATSLYSDRTPVSITVVVKDGGTTLTSNAATMSVIAPSPTYPASLTPTLNDPTGDVARNLIARPSYHVDPVFFPNGSFRFAYDEALKNPVWSAYASFRTASTFPSPTRVWNNDDRLATPLVNDSDMGTHGGAGFYLANLTGFDRGHMVPFAELGSRYGFVTNTFDDTCRMSNIVAQVSNFNQGFWQNLEDAFGNLTDSPSAFTRIWIYTGSVFQTPTNYWVPSTETYTTTPASLPAGTLAIAIPTACYKIAVAEPAVGQTLPRVMAWVGANRFYVNATESGDHWKYVTSVARIEALTGLKFFPALESDPNFAAVKANVDVRPWGSTFAKSSGPNVHIIEPSWDIKAPGTDVVASNPNAPEYVLQTLVTQGDTVNFTAAASTTNGGTIPTASWTFSDGTPSVPVTLTVTNGVATPDTKTHTFATSGTFTATFSATDGLNATNTITRVITVLPSAAANQPPYTTPSTLPGVTVSTSPAGTSVTQVFTVGDDTTTPLSAIGLTATSDNQTVLPDANIVAAFSGTATWTLTMTPAAAGTAHVSVVLTDKDSATTTKTFTFTATTPTSGGTPVLIISQYYEGTSNNKWIEITNVGTGDWDAATTPMTLWLWANPYAVTPSFGATALTGTLTVGASKIYMNTSAVLPTATYLTGTGIVSSACNFNGDDVVFLSPTAQVPATGTITNGATAYAARVDCIGTNDSATWMGNSGTTGNTTYAKALGCNRSYVRNATVKTANPTYTPSEWTQVDAVEITAAAPSAVDTAASNSTNRLGYHYYIP